MQLWTMAPGAQSTHQQKCYRAATNEGTGLNGSIVAGRPATDHRGMVPSRWAWSTCTQSSRRTMGDYEQWGDEFKLLPWRRVQDEDVEEVVQPHRSSRTAATSATRPPQPAPGVQRGEGGPCATLRPWWTRPCRGWSGRSRQGRVHHLEFANGQIIVLDEGLGRRTGADRLRAFYPELLQRGSRQE